ncbi:hypothetical protein FEI17_09240 [Kosakonia radicincitans]|uniref:hypothetical protein n=1 Tax=Kosakonia radicincitans TaxID=283686 RepID=UPI0011EF50A2|nr:hypothetical protein [Kosakonia radicincitans]QEM90821.1 hypothetical protein FEI17_09240 [Kosakonia radicincitans]
MFKTYIKCLYKETKKVIENFGAFQSILTTLISVIAYYFAFNLIDHIKPYQVEITSCIVVVLLFIGGYMTWQTEHEQLQEMLISRKNNVVVIESNPVWLQIGSATMSEHIKTLRLYFTFNIQNHKNHPVRIDSMDLSKLETTLDKRISKKAPISYQKTVPLEVKAKSPNSLSFYNEYDFSNLSFQEQLNYLEIISSKQYTISFKVYSVDGWETVETQLPLDFKKLMLSSQIKDYKFDENVINDCISRLTTS